MELLCFAPKQTPDMFWDAENIPARSQLSQPGNFPGSDPQNSGKPVDCGCTMRTHSVVWFLLEPSTHTVNKRRTSQVHHRHKSPLKSLTFFFFNLKFNLQKLRGHCKDKAGHTPNQPHHTRAGQALSMQEAQYWLLEHYSPPNCGVPPSNWPVAYETNIQNWKESRGCLGPNLAKKLHLHLSLLWNQAEEDVLIPIFFLALLRVALGKPHLQQEWRQNALQVRLKLLWLNSCQQYQYII